MDTQPVATETRPPPLTEAQRIEAKILSVLTHIPFLTHTMLQVGIGVNRKTSEWRPILDELIGKEVITQHAIAFTGPDNRAANYILYHLTSNKYEPANWVK